MSDGSAEAEVDDAPTEADDALAKSETAPDETADAAMGDPGWEPDSDRPFTYTAEDREARAFDRTDRPTRLERWEVVGRNALCPLLEHHRDSVVLEIEDTAVAVEDGFSPDAVHVARLRQTITELESTVEECLARLAEGTQPWEHSARRIPDWRLREELGLDPVENESDDDVSDDPDDA